MKVWMWLALALCLGACVSKVTVPPLAEGVRVAVADVVVPQADWELLAGVLPSKPVTLPDSDRVGIRQAVLDELGKRPWPVLPISTVIGCEERVVTGLQRQRFSAVRYWQEVGRCAEADVVVIPFVLWWEDRIGGEWGVERPAHVIFDLYLVEVESGAVRRFHYEEEQVGLIENLFFAKKFARRQGRWLSALELAREAIAQGLSELGLSPAR